MLVLSYGFGSATYTLDDEAVTSLPETLERAPLEMLLDETYDSDVAYRQAVVNAVGAEAYDEHRSALVTAAISMNPTLILAGILGFVASFAISLGPVMWVLFSELFPTGYAGWPTLLGFVNSASASAYSLCFRGNW